MRPATPSSCSPGATEHLLSLIKSCAHDSHLRQIHARILRTRSLEEPTISLRFLSRAASASVSGGVTYARRFFSQIKNPSLAEFNAMIRAYSGSDSPAEGLYLYREMRRLGQRTDPLTSSFCVKSCIKMESLTGGLQIHGRIVRDGHQSDSLLLTALMDFYSICYKSEEACAVFDEMPERDTVAWNVLISCYLRNRRTRDVLAVFDAMIGGECGCQPDDVTCLHVLQACNSLNAVEFGGKVHEYIEERGYGDAVKLCNSLITMYSRCGSMDKAFMVFKGMRVKNVVSWSALISGLAMNGRGKEAIEAYLAMLRANVVPDDQTFTGVLSACSHSGLVDEGMLFFEGMSKDFKITPNVHHYGCMVDLLGRAGSLDQAYELILSMSSKPDSTIWRTLLGACRIHRHVTLGERVVWHLTELKAQEAGDYVLLLNIYSSVGDWEKVTEVRKFMKENQIQTTPGCTTITLNGIVHEFTVDDVSHPRQNEIYTMLDEIGSQLKIAGYVPEISSELHNLSSEEKGYRLSYHSEKLAIAFGILATPPGTTLRLANNLRICVDCHNFAKVLSSVYDRIVVIRDRSRLHHFQGGHCSCNDYW
ncbi:hypothetical protein EUGRSUZ_B00510 [Eucalyptus grandis]|uniref:Uncharacterized protein n=2 Tax=Eucalyptus grandis TaxID=71139 RepID=A0ACC3LPD3_EUCGR|nr:hypothetical protein EUGRSUZ_B00510 [Eucalyptus grandis]